VIQKFLAAGFMFCAVVLVLGAHPFTRLDLILTMASATAACFYWRSLA